MIHSSLQGLFLLLLLLTWHAAPANAQAVPAASDTVVLDVESAIQRALSVSPDISHLEAGRDFAAARQRLAEASRFLPELHATTAHAPVPGLTDSPFPSDALYLDPNLRNTWENPSFFNQVELRFAQPVYTWGQLSGSIRAARHGTDVARAEVEEQESEVAYRTAEMYYSLILTEELHRLTDEAGGIVEQAMREITRLMDEGDPNVQDADLFQVQIVEQEYLRRVAEVEQRRILARVALARQLFLPEHTYVVPREMSLEPIPFRTQQLDHYFAQALLHRAELAQARAGMAARQALVEVARSDYFPKLFLAGSARLAAAPGRFRQPNPFINEPLVGRSLLAGIGLRQQLTFGQTSARVEQARAQLEEVRHQLVGAEQLILFQVEEAYRNLLIAETALQTQGQALQVSREWLRTEQINFDLDLGSTEYLIRAVRANLDLQAGYYTTVHQYNIAVLRLLRSIGLLPEMARSGTLVD